MTSSIKLFDVVALTEDMPQFGLLRGQIGRRSGVEVRRAISDYTVTFDGKEIAAGATVQALPVAALARRC